jgi:hypothetical protein
MLLRETEGSQLTAGLSIVLVVLVLERMGEGWALILAAQ